MNELVLDELVLEKVKLILSEQFCCDESKINLDTRIIEDLGADSLDFAELVQMIEDEFDFEVMEENVEDMHTVEDIVNYIEGKVNSEQNSEQGSN